MKKIFAIALLLGSLPVAFHLIANADDTNGLEKPKIISYAPSAVYAPTGFDSNDNTEIVFEGIFPNACYRVGLTYFNVDEVNKKVFVTDTAHFFENTMCAEMIVPYTKDIKMGVLEPGNYTVYFKNSRGMFNEEASLPVKVAQNPTPDDNMYAPVENSQYFPPKNGNPAMLNLIGAFTNTCMQIDRVDVVQKNDSNVIEILPYAKIEGDNCTEANPGIPFEYQVPMENLTAGRYLLHIRSLNGRSVNEIADIK
ncbi:MAG: hypothetical protein KDD33_13070 [Bdellovibrionales bacterium]|nr:hypothetical protein [Bdellovibrionales bacterium]